MLFLQIDHDVIYHLKEHSSEYRDARVRDCM